MKKTLGIITIFLGSLLLFGVQPMIGRTLLPAFGGTSAVWMVCLCAFQVMLLFGYFYGHWMTVSLAGRRKPHIVLLAVAAAWAFAAAALRPKVMEMAGGTSLPALEVLAYVVLLIGVPYVLLSANSSLVQAWAAGPRQSGGRGVYRLYAVSNAGSLAGLLLYPFLLEPNVSLTCQWYGFGAGILAYTVLLACFSRLARADADAEAEEGAAASPAPAPGAAEEASPCGRLDRFLWLLLPALSCFLLNAVTAHMTLDLIPLPLLWAYLLGLFLFSYVIGFSGWAERNVRWLALASLFFFVVVCRSCYHPFSETRLVFVILRFGAFLLVACTFLHGWLYRIRPASSQLTRYYLLGALGGAIGGILASLGAPVLFDSVAEFPVSLFAVCLLATARLLARKEDAAPQAASRAKLAAAAGVILFATGTAFFLRNRHEWTGYYTTLYEKRGFFGTIRIHAEKVDEYRTCHTFMHGTTVHGVQLWAPGGSRTPTTYYTPYTSGYGIVGHPKFKSGEPMRVNVTGLGVGTLFCYGRTNDYYRAYEISPEVYRAALDTNLFTFVSDCPARKEISVKDARKGLEQELAEGVEPYDVIVIDAFTGDNVPYHLSTKEAFDLYFKLLKPDGVLVVNISNWHLSLAPFMQAVSERFHVPVRGFMAKGDAEALHFPTLVAFFCRDWEKMAPLPAGVEPVPFDRYSGYFPLPTDEKGSFAPLVKW